MKIINIALLTAVTATTASAFVSPSVAGGVKSVAGRSSQGVPRNLFNQLFSSAANTSKYPVMAEESVMSQKAHGTSEKPVMKDLRWGCDWQTADRICVSGQRKYCWGLFLVES